MSLFKRERRVGQVVGQIKPGKDIHLLTARKITSGGTNPIGTKLKIRANKNERILTAERKKIKILKFKTRDFENKRDGRSWKKKYFLERKGKNQYISVIQKYMFLHAHFYIRMRGRKAKETGVKEIPCQVC